MIHTSVIIPVYNTSPYLEECIDSVYNQTQKEIEVIAINDGSTDDSWTILQELKRKYPGLVVISQENSGLGYTRNVGLSMAKGEYVLFLDSDDYIREDTLEVCYHYATRNRLDVVLFDANNFENTDERNPIIPNADDRHNVIEERDEVFSGIYFLEKYYNKTYEPSACFVYCSLNFLRRNNIYFLPRVYFEDNEFHCKIMILADRIMYIPRMFYQRRCRSESITGTVFDLRKANDHIEVVNAITALKTCNYGKGWHIVKKINIELLKYVAYVCYTNHLYIKDKSLLPKILKARLRMM